MSSGFYGSPWTVPICGAMDWAFQLRDVDDEIGAKFGLIPDDVDVLVTHSPPLGQGDQLAELGPDGRLGPGHRRAGKPPSHLWSRVLMERVEAVAPPLHVFGHYHKGYGVSRKEGLATTFVNTATCVEAYHPEHVPIVIEFA